MGEREFEVKPGFQESAQQIMAEQKSSFKLIKNTKGYNWEIKIVEDDIEEMKRKTLLVNQWAMEKFGRQE